jgi:CspA family cold shock protein
MRSIFAGSSGDFAIASGNRNSFSVRSLSALVLRIESEPTKTIFEILISHPDRGAKTTTYKVTIMTTGTVKWFNPTKGFGFIQPDAGGPDVFVHVSAVERSSLGSIHEGQQIAYEIERDQRSGKMSAGQLQAV